MLRVLIAFILNYVATYISYKKSSLSFSGFIASFLMGSFIFIWGGIYSWFLMGAFFVSSSILTKFKSRRKSNIADITEKGGVRDYIQVFANGGVGLICAFLGYLTDHPVFVIAFAGAFAASNADTWASEIGVLSSKPPILIHNFKKAEKGSSGSVSLLGITASFFGACFIAGVYCFNYLLQNRFQSLPITNVLIIILCGFLGSLLDSLLGALFQANYRCEVCKLVTEKKVHHNRPTLKIKGFFWLNNDLVNFISIALATVFAGLLYVILS